MGCLSGCLMSSAWWPSGFRSCFVEFSQMIFGWICWGESGLPVLFLCHLRTSPSRVTLFCSTDFSLQWLILLPSMDFKEGGFQVLWCTGLVALRHEGSSWIKDWTHIPCTGRGILNHWATREVMRHLFLIQPSHSPLEITPFMIFGYLFILAFLCFISYKCNHK